MKLASLLGFAGLLAGCASPALHGIPAEQRIELPDELLGEWHDEDRVTLLVERGSDGSCDVLARSEEEGREPVEVRLEAFAIELAGHRIVDVTLAESELEKVGEIYGTLLIPTHLFFRVQGDGQDLTLTSLDAGWLEGRPLDAVTFAVFDDDDVPLVTAGSQKLLELLTAAAGDDDAWEGEWHLARRP